MRKFDMTGERTDEPAPARDYEGPVHKLLALGKPLDSTNYQHLGIDKGHVPALIDMAKDMGLHQAHEDSAEVWAPVHAWRALGQLGAEEAIEPLTDLLRLVDEIGDDFGSQDLP
jgi:hypothetical protein